MTVDCKGLSARKVLSAAILHFIFTGVALAADDQPSLLGDFYGFAGTSACYADSPVFRITDHEFLMRVKGSEFVLGEKLEHKHDGNRWTMSGVPVALGQDMEKKPKKFEFTFEYSDDTWTPVAASFDNDRGNVKSGFQDYYTMASCASPSLMGKLLLLVGWHAPYDKDDPQTRYLKNTDGSWNSIKQN